MEKKVISTIVTNKKTLPIQSAIPIIKKKTQPSIPIKKETTQKPTIKLTAKKETSSTKSPVLISKKSSSKKIDYGYAGKESLNKTIAKAFPKQLIPTKRMGPILGWIFLVVVIIALMQFPLGQMLSGNMNMIISVGYPWPFLEFSLIETENLPILPINLILDLVLYIIVAYIIDITFNLILKIPFMKTEKQLKQRPVIFKNKHPAISEKLTKKVFEKPKK